ncbi:hypothetical protein PSTT_04715, partial [Puccinia striiformis]
STSQKTFFGLAHLSGKKKICAEDREQRNGLDAIDQRYSLYSQFAYLRIWTHMRCILRWHPHCVEHAPEDSSIKAASR